jgi:hypothetical protein
LKESRKSFSNFIEEQKQQKKLADLTSSNKKKEVDVQVDELIKVRQLRPKRAFGLEDLDDIGIL